MVSRTMQTEVVRKFTGRTVLGIYPSSTGVLYCVELKLIGLEGRYYRSDRNTWQNMKLNFVLQQKAQLGYTAVLYMLV